MLKNKFSMLIIETFSIFEWKTIARSLWTRAPETRILGEVKKMFKNNFLSNIFYICKVYDLS